MKWLMIDWWMIDKPRHVLAPWLTHSAPSAPSNLCQKSQTFLMTCALKMPQNDCLDSKQMYVLALATGYILLSGKTVKMPATET